MLGLSGGTTVDDDQEPCHVSTLAHSDNASFYMNWRVTGRFWSQEQMLLFSVLHQLFLEIDSEMYSHTEHLVLVMLSIEGPLRDCQQTWAEGEAGLSTFATGASAIQQQIPNEGKGAELWHVHIIQGEEHTLGDGSLHGKTPEEDSNVKHCHSALYLLGQQEAQF